MKRISKVIKDVMICDLDAFQTNETNEHHSKQDPSGPSRTNLVHIVIIRTKPDPFRLYSTNPDHFRPIKTILNQLTDLD